MAGRFSAKWPVQELSDDRKCLAAKMVTSLYAMSYRTFMKQLKGFMQYGKYPAVVFRVGRRLRPRKREHCVSKSIRFHIGIRTLNQHFYPGLDVQ